MEKESDYLVRNPKTIVDYLSSIFKNKCIITAHFGENNASFLTVITDIDAKNNTLKVDCAPTEVLNKELLNSVKVLFRTQMDGIKVSFSGKNIKKTKSGTQPALEMPIPDAIFWLQRRQFYRVRVPLSHTGSYCEITTCRTRDADGAPHAETAMFRLADLSISGFALLNSDPHYASLFTDDISFTDCKLHLNDGPDSSIGFVIKSITDVKVSSTATEQRIGCRFTELTPSFESCIQRYMQFIERQLKNIGI